MEQIEELTRLGPAAATRLAQQLGLPHDDPVVVSRRGNLLVQLAPAPVVAGVPTLTGRSRADPMAWLAREVAVAGYWPPAAGRSCHPCLTPDLTGRTGSLSASGSTS